MKDGKKIIHIGLFFSLLTVAGNLFSYLLTKWGYLSLFELFTTQCAAALIRLTGLEAATSKNVIYLPSVIWLVDAECTAINLMVIYLAFVLVYPSSTAAKTAGSLVGLPFLFLANLLRLLAMAWVEKWQPAYSGYFHDYIWQVAFLILIVIMWVIWLEGIANRAAKKSIPA